MEISTIETKLGKKLIGGIKLSSSVVLVQLEAISDAGGKLIRGVMSWRKGGGDRVEIGGV